MKKLYKIDGSCVVVALHYVSEKDEETVIRICTLHGFKEKQGMDDPSWKKAAADLGIAFSGGIIPPVTLKKFISDHPTGLYLLGTTDHMLCVDAGIVVDPRNESPPGMNRRILQAWKIKNK